MTDIDLAPGKLEITSMEHDHSGNMGYATGTDTITDDAGKVVDSGKWIEVRKKVNGKWYVHRDIWNSDMTPAG